MEDRLKFRVTSSSRTERFERVVRDEQSGTPRTKYHKDFQSRFQQRQKR